MKECACLMAEQKWEIEGESRDYITRENKCNEKCVR